MIDKVIGCAVLAATLAGLCGASPANRPDYGKVALSFEPNRGQASRDVQYLAHGAGYSVGLQRDGFFLSLRSDDPRARSRRVGLRFQGAAAISSPLAGNPQQGKVNYFLGSDASQWRTDIPTYGRIEYRGVYPGIDLAYYGTQGRLEYDWIVNPGADASRIRLAISGGSGLRLESNGDLTLGEGAVALLQKKPVVYQIAADGTRQSVAAGYVLIDRNTVGFRVAGYDHRRALVIDPVLSYATFLGGSGSDGIAGIQVDSAGSAYITGFTTSSNFPQVASIQGSYKGSNSGGNGLAAFGDAFVAKLNPAGTGLVFTTYLGGKDDDIGTALTFDASGNIYVTGDTRSTDFPATAGAFQTKFGGTVQADFYDAGDAFVAKLGPNGNKLLYCTYLGGTQNEMSWGIAVDSTGVVTIAGGTQSTNFPTKNAAFATFRGAAGFGDIQGGDGFLARLDAAGASLVYSTFIGGSGQDMVKSLAVDSQGNAYVAGDTYSPNFPVTPGAYQTTFRGSQNTTQDSFVAKFSSQGALVYCTYLGGTSRDWVWGMAVDATGNAILTGGTYSKDYPVTANAIQKTFGGSGAVGSPDDIFLGDAFATKLSADGSTLIYSTYLGGTGDEVGTAVAVDASGNAFITGFTLSMQFPVSTDALQKTMAGFGGQGGTGIGADGTGNINTGDAFFTELSPTGALLYSSYYGGTGDDAAMAIALDPAGAAYIAGGTVSSGLHTTSGAAQSTYGGTGALFPRGDGFVTKFDFGGVLPVSPASIGFISGLPTTGIAGAALKVTAQVLDAQSKGVAGVTVAFSATNGTANPASAVSDVNGQASTNVTLGASGTAAKITATAGGLTPAVLSISVLPAGPVPTITGVLNGGSFLAKNSPGEWISFFGTNFTTGQFQSDKVPLGTALGGATVKVNGAPIPLYLVYPGQINAILPYETPLGNATVTVENGGIVSQSFTFPVQATAPGIFLYGNNRAIVQNFAPDGTVTLNTSANPVPAGDVVIAYLTGQGALDHPVTSGDIAPLDQLVRPVASYSATIGGEPATVSFLGLTPGQISLDQADIVVPSDLAPGDYPLLIKIGNDTSNGPIISVTKPRN
ncbi:MAG TPA: SBBP repeat-containing protein [Bryobacteraceae bacterium]|jgi:uncharacterized protein (TIGR03437 family)